MKDYLLKVNYYIMSVLLIISSLYSIGNALNYLIIAIRLKYDTNIVTPELINNGRLFRDLYEQESSVIYGFIALFILLCISIMTLVFYKKRLNQFTFALFSIAVIPQFWTIASFRTSISIIPQILRILPGLLHFIFLIIAIMQERTKSNHTAE